MDSQLIKIEQSLDHKMGETRSGSGTASIPPSWVSSGWEKGDRKQAGPTR